jgi:hypothetical protein
MDNITLEKLWGVISHGDRVTIRVPAGIGRNGQEWAQRTGTAVMKGPHGWVLNMGGKHGIPGVATVSNFVSVRHRGYTYHAK